LLPLAAWRWTPLQDWLSPQRAAEFMTHFSSPAGRVLVAVTGGWLASILASPLTFLAVVGAVAFPGWLAFVYVLGGALVGSALGFVGGRVMSRGALERISGSRLGQLSRQLAKRGTLAVAVLRLVSIAPFAVFNLVAGASHLGVPAGHRRVPAGDAPRFRRNHVLFGNHLGGGQRADLEKRDHRRGGGARAG